MSKVLFLILSILATSSILVLGSVGLAVESPTITSLEVASNRTLYSKTFDNGDGSFTLISFGAPIHYEDEYGDLQTKNNALVPSTLPWDYEMTQDSYTARVLSDFTAGQVIEWEMEGQTLAFQPMALEWTNDLDQISQISMPQDTASLVTNTPHLTGGADVGYELGVINWSDAYGTGRNFWWECDTGRLRKTLELESAPPAPPQYIIDGGNPVLRLNFIFDPSPDLDIYIDGELWDKKTHEVTFNYTEFRYLGETLWYFGIANAWDSSDDMDYHEIALASEFSKSGNSLYVSVRVPYDWLGAATYPVYVDPYIQEFSSLSDGFLFDYSTTYSTARDSTTGRTPPQDERTWINVGQLLTGGSYYLYRSMGYFPTGSLPDDCTITNADIFIYRQRDPGDTDFCFIVQWDPDRVYPRDTMVVEDYNRTYYEGDGCDALCTDTWTSGYNELNFKEANFNWINKTGDTRPVIRSNRDVTDPGTSPTGGAPDEYARWNPVESGGTSKDPYMRVDYTVGVPFSWGQIIG